MTAFSSNPNLNLNRNSNPNPKLTPTPFRPLVHSVCVLCDCVVCEVMITILYELLPLHELTATNNVAKVSTLTLMIIMMVKSSETV